MPLAPPFCPSPTPRRPPSVQAPLPVGHAHNKLLRSQATPPAPLAISGPAPRGPPQGYKLSVCAVGGLRAPQAQGLLRGGCLAPLQGLPPSVLLRSAAAEGNDPDRNPIESERVPPRKHLPPPVGTCFPHPMRLNLSFQIEPVRPTEAAGLCRGGPTVGPRHVPHRRGLDFLLSTFAFGGASCLHSLPLRGRARALNSSGPAQSLHSYFGPLPLKPSES